MGKNVMHDTEENRLQNNFVWNSKALSGRQVDQMSSFMASAKVT